jgi:hypothetical protein
MAREIFMGAIMHTVLQYIQMSDISDLLDLSSGTGPKLLDEFEERERMENQKYRHSPTFVCRQEEISRAMRSARNFTTTDERWGAEVWLIPLPVEV